METTSAVGALYLGGGTCRFRVWAPFAQAVCVRLHDPHERDLPLVQEPGGTFSGEFTGIRPGTPYLIHLDESGTGYPDPASRHQPEGVFGRSAVLDPSFPWQDSEWRGMDLAASVMYELHVGTFTPTGTFDACIPRLDRLRRLGVTAIEIMPVAQFPGRGNWGYDGVFPFAVQNTYGGPDGLKRLVDACHRAGLAVILDVVYNHLGPEGNVFWAFGPYFTDAYRTPWGPAINFDGPDSDAVRAFFIQNALYWLDDFHFDALRLDAVHAIHDRSAVPFLRELAEAVQDLSTRTGIRRYLIPESDLNDSRLIRPASQWGCELDAQWSDDFHHAVHALLTGERSGYYQDFGNVAHLAGALKDGYVYSGQYSPFRRRRHGNRADDLPPEKFVVSIQNHDQAGNRAMGERLSSLISFEALKLAAGVLLLSPYIPLLFMGEEYGETAPFQYFVDHSDPHLLEAVRSGRRKEFSHDPTLVDVPDPSSETTRSRCVLNWEMRDEGHHATLFRLYTTLIGWRKELSVLRTATREGFSVGYSESHRTLWHKRVHDGEALFCAFNFGRDAVDIAPPEKSQAIPGRLLFDSASPDWDGPGSRLPSTLDCGTILRLEAKSFCVYHKERRSS